MKNALWAMTHPGYVPGGYSCEVCGEFFTRHKEYDKHIWNNHQYKAQDLMCAKECDKHEREKHNDLLDRT